MLDVDYSVSSRACEQSGKRNGAGRKSGEAERSVERAWQKTTEWEREVTEWERRSQRVESAAHSPLQPNISLTSSDV